LYFVLIIGKKLSYSLDTLDPRVGEVLVGIAGDGGRTGRGVDRETGRRHLAVGEGIEFLGDILVFSQRMPVRTEIFAFTRKSAMVYRR
jgi:hypothetical protein